jgi:four helix bundle protein
MKVMEGNDAVLLEEALELLAHLTQPPSDRVTGAVAETSSTYGKAPKSHQDLRLYQRAFELASEVYELSKTFPREEQFSLTNQIRRSSRSVCANLAEAWRKRRYKAAFVAKLSDCEAECAETQTWIEFARECGFMTPDQARQFWDRYEQLIRGFVHVIHNADKWTIL